MTPFAIASLTYAIASFPQGDMREAVAHPSPAATIQVAEDIAGVADAVNPHARAIAAGLSVAAIMLRYPSANPTADAQTGMGRGGRRG